MIVIRIRAILRLKEVLNLADFMLKMRPETTLACKSSNFVPNKSILPARVCFS